MDRRFALLLATASALLPARAQEPGAPPGCAEAPIAAQHPCADPALARADATLSRLHDALRARQADPRALDDEQRRWRREVLGHCPDTACAAAAYAARTAGLRRRNETPVERPAWTRPPLIARRIAAIDDTHVEYGLWFRGGMPRRLQLELHVDPGDRLAWGDSGPRVLLQCSDPHRREGYAGRFELRRQASGVDFVRVRRGHAHGFVMVDLELGRDLPLDEDVRCTVLLGEWLLERPSTLYLVDADVALPPRADPD